MTTEQDSSSKVVSFKTNSKSTSPLKSVFKLLNGLESIADLRAVEKALPGLFAQQHTKNLYAARLAAEAVVKGYGFTLTELTGTVSKKKVKKSKQPSRKSAPKYKNPADATETWSGKGRPTNWFKAALKAGTTREQMEI